jgi:hypothetical protein
MSKCRKSHMLAHRFGESEATFLELVAEASLDTQTDPPRPGAPDPGLGPSDPVDGPGNVLPQAPDPRSDLTYGREIRKTEFLVSDTTYTFPSRPV